MNKILLVAISGFLLAISANPALADYLILSTYSEGTIILDDVLDELEVEYDLRYSYYWEQWQIDDLDDFEAVFVSPSFGYSNTAIVRTLFEYAEDGGNLIWMGATSNDDDWVEVFNEYVQGEYNYVWPGGFELVDDTHRLAENLPDEYDWYMYAARLWYEIDDDEFETVTVNNDNIPTYGVKRVENAGEFFFIGYDPSSNYYNMDEDAFEILQQMVFNILQYERGSILYGVVTNATTRRPVEDVYIDLYDSDADSLISHDSTDDDGNYECSERIFSDMSYHAVYSKEMFVAETIENLEGTPNENIEQDINLIPFLRTDIEALHMIPLGTWVDVTGIVTIPTNTIDTEHTSFYIQDESQYGVHIYGDDPWDAEMYGELNRGDEVRIVGQLDEYEGITELNHIYLWEVISNGNPMPELLTFNTGTMSNMQEMEGSWAHIDGYLQNDPGEVGSYTLVVDDSSGGCNVRIFESTGIDLFEAEQGDWLMIDGVISLFENSVQIVPALQEDITGTPQYIPDFTRAAVDLLPTEWAITSVYPNPFNSAVNITVAVPEPGMVKTEIFDLLGRSVAIIQHETIQPGYHHLRWHAEGPSGIYFLRFTSESGWNSTHKLLLMK
ncbi:MAG: T9SS type A sorting domain-containing protein [Candidatus Electryonea clarkiae]|nr:T9SS type A sorting domain-containing protein [Candidatus Electryonea clarkiae]MDP8288035.1 T9SS type A sorting domain-containing protein [Candidatus Electryonea clarkiae]